MCPTEQLTCKPLFIHLNVLTLYSLYVFHSVCHVHSHLDLFNINADVHSYNTRSKSCLRVQQFKYSSSQKNWLHMSTKFYNSLPTKVKSLTFSQFKNKIKYVLINECLYSIDHFFNINWDLYI